MALSRTRSAALYGIEAHFIDVEVDMYAREIPGKSGEIRDNDRFLRFGEEIRDKSGDKSGTTTASSDLVRQIRDNDRFLRFGEMFHTPPTLHPRMPKSKRIVVPGLPHHITQRGNGRAKVFDCDQDRTVFLDLLARYSLQYGLSIWGYCLMSNHFHVVAVPAHECAAAKVLGRLEADYARFLNVRRRTSGHLWQARYHSVAMEPPYCWRALAYVERNPVRAGMTLAAVDYPWSSAAARLGAAVAPPWLDLDPWSQHWSTVEWLHMLADESEDEFTRVELQEATLSGHPWGPSLVQRLEKELGRRLRRGKAGRPPKQAADTAQRSFFSGAV